MKKIIAVVLTLLLIGAVTTAEEEPTELLEYFGHSINEFSSALPDIDPDSDPLNIGTADGSIYASADEETGNIDFIYLSSAEGSFSLCSIVPGMDLEDVMLAFADADLLVDDEDYRNDETIFAVDPDYTISFTAEFENGICVAISAISYM